MRTLHTPALTSGSLTILRLCGLSHGADLRHVDEEEGEGAPGQALAHRPRRRRSRQHPQVRRGGRWRRGPGREALMAVRPSPPVRDAMATCPCVPNVPCVSRLKLAVSFATESRMWLPIKSALLSKTTYKQACFFSQSFNKYMDALNQGVHTFNLNIL